MGIEVEYGISAPTHPSANPISTSAQIVLAYAASLHAARSARWDYELETPLNDARGYDATQKFSPLWEGEDTSPPNVILPNGARLYVDHAHPEYSAPEVLNARDAVIWDKAGERIMERAAQYVSEIPGNFPLQLYKNNGDGKGSSYGTHENYLMQRSVPFEAIVQGLTPFFVTRQVFTGSGKVGIGQHGEYEGFQLSQRADFIEVEVGLETTLKRGIINTRDEPHADIDKYRRLHVIIGDANLAEYATYLKMGTTALVINCIQAYAQQNPDAIGCFADLMPADPVKSVRMISHDPALTTDILLENGKKYTAIDIQRIYHERVGKYLATIEVDPLDHHIHHLWGETLDKLSRDPLLCADILDWPAKLRILEGFRQRESLSWNSPRLQLVDLQYSDVRLDKGIYNRLVTRGSMKRLVNEAEVIAAINEPPANTRAYFRGKCLEKFSDSIAAANWDSVIFDIGEPSLIRIPMLEPLRGTKAHVGELLENAASALEVVEQLISEK